ncbi:MAG: hypothetical protein ACM65M_20910 [Microcoleus sp.]
MSGLVGCLSFEPSSLNFQLLTRGKSKNYADTHGKVCHLPEYLALNRPDRPLAHLTEN